MDEFMKKLIGFITICVISMLTAYGCTSEQATLESHIQEGNQLFFEGHYRQAEKEYKSALDLDPASIAAWSGLAETYLKLGNTKEAYESYETILDMEPDNTKALLKLASFNMLQNTLDQAEVISRMSDYLTANRTKINAIIGLGDLVTGSIKRVFRQVGVAPGQIPVVGWGNSVDTAEEVLEGYVKAAMWADPQAISYLGLSMGLMASRGIQPGFNIMTGTLYEADRAAYYRDIMAGK